MQLLNLHGEIILIGLTDLNGFIICGRSHKIKHYTDIVVLMANLWLDSFMRLVLGLGVIDEKNDG